MPPFSFLLYVMFGGFLFNLLVKKYSESENKWKSIPHFFPRINFNATFILGSSKQQQQLFVLLPKVSSPKVVLSKETPEKQGSF